MVVSKNYKIQRLYFYSESRSVLLRSFRVVEWIVNALFACGFCTISIATTGTCKGRFKIWLTRVASVLD
jgi:hypothetical protein